MVRQYTCTSKLMSRMLGALIEKIKALPTSVRMV